MISLKALTLLKLIQFYSGKNVVAYCCASSSWYSPDFDQSRSESILFHIGAMLD